MIDFEQKRRELGMDREDVLTQLQAVLEGWYAGQVRAKKLHQGVLQLVTPSAVVAGELRMRQVELLDAAEKLTGERPRRLAISIGQLRG